MDEFDIAAYTKDDIDTVVASRTARLVSLKPHLKQKQDYIVRELQRRADGVFQWVKASLTHLDEDGVRAEDVERKLAGFYSDMTQAYDKIMGYLLQRAYGCALQPSLSAPRNCCPPSSWKTGILM
jgi:hypothetical protein